MKALKKRRFCIHIAIILLFCYFAFPDSAKAGSSNEDKVFYLNDNQSITGTLFGDDEPIYPGKELKREFYIANGKSFDCYLSTIDITGKLYTKDKKLLSRNDSSYINYVSNAKIKFLCENNLIFSGTIEDFLRDNFKINYYTEIKRNRRKKFVIEYEFDIQADNTTMGLQHIFDITFRFSQVDDNSGGNNGGGNNGGNNGENSGGNTGGNNNGGNNGGNTGGNTGGNNGGGTGDTTGGNTGNNGGSNTGTDNSGPGGNAGGSTGSDGNTGENFGNNSEKPPVIESDVKGVAIIMADNSGGEQVEKRTEGVTLVKTGYIADTKVLLMIGVILCTIGLRFLITTKASKEL